MEIKVQRITGQGQLHSFSEKDSWVKECIEQSLQGTLEKCTASISLRNYNDQVQVSGNVEVVIRLFCDVCAAEVNVSFNDPINLLYVPAESPDPNVLPKTEKDLEKIQVMVSLGQDDLDIGWYYDGTLEMRLVLTEHLLIQKQSILQCKDENVVRVSEGECLNLPSKGSKNTYKPFAGLDIL